MCGNPIEAIGNAVSDVGNAVVDVAGGVVDAVGTAAETVGNAAVQTVEAAASAVAAPVEAVVDSVGAVATGVFQGQSFGDIMGNVGDQWVEAGGQVLDSVGNVAEAAVDVALVQANAALDIGGSVVDAAQEMGGPIGAIADVVDAGAQWVEDNKETIIDVAQVAIPAVLAATGVGAPIAAAVAAGIALYEANMDGEINSGELLDVGIDTAGAFVPGVGGLAGDIAEGGVEAVKTLAEGGDIGDALKQGGLEFVEEKFGEGAAKAVEAGVALAENIAEGKDIDDALLSTLGDVGKEAIGDLLSEDSALGKEINEVLGDKGAEMLEELMDSPLGDGLKGAGEAILEGKDVGDALKEGALDAGKDIFENTELGGDLQKLLGEDGAKALGELLEGKDIGDIAKEFGGEALEGLGGDAFGDKGSEFLEDLADMSNGKTDFSDMLQETFGGTETIDMPAFADMATSGQEMMHQMH